MTTDYLWIKAMQEPFDHGIDEQGRLCFGFSIMAQKAQSGTFARELISILSAANVGVFGSTLFSSTLAVIPPTGTVVDIIETGGMSPLKVQNDVMPKYQRPTAKILVHAVKSEDAIAKARAAYNALVVVRNQAVTVA